MQTTPAKLSLQISWRHGTLLPSLTEHLLRTKGRWQLLPGEHIENILSALFRVMKEQQGAINVVSFMEKRKILPST